MTHWLVSPIGPRAERHLLLAARATGAKEIDIGQMFVWLVVAGLGIGLICALLVVGTRIAHRRRFNCHATVFGGLCKIHGLDAAARRLLKRVVRFHGLAQPGRLFVEPRWLDPANLGSSFQARAAELEKLRRQLFYVRRAATDGGAGPGAKE